MKTTKIALYVILLSLAVILVASGIFLATFDANEYKHNLATLVEEKTGRTLSFSGDAELMLYPNFGMSLGGMQFSNAQGFGDAPMISVEEASISVDVQSVLMLQPKISQLILSELRIDLQKNKNGISNWDDLQAKDDNQQASTATKQTSQQSDEPKDGNDFELAGAFEGINLSNAFVSWRDDSTGEKVNLQGLNLTTGKITPTEPFPMSLELNIQKDQDVTANINLTSNIFYDYKKQHLSLDDLNLKLTASGEIIPVDEANLELKTKVKLDLEKQNLSLPNLYLSAKTQGGIFKQADVSIGGDFRMNLGTQNLKLSQLNLLANIQDPTMPNGALESSIKSDVLAVDLPKRKVDLTQLKLAINNILLSGEVHVKDYAQPSLSFDLASNKIDLDELLGLNEKKQSAESEQETTPNEGEQQQDVKIALPTELLRNIELDGLISIEELKAMNVKTTQNKLKVIAQKGVIEIKPLALNLYQGSLNKTLKVDVRKDIPKYQIKTNLSDVQIGKLLIDFMQLDKIRGSANIAIDLTTQGEWLKDIKKNLNGDVSLHFADGALVGFNLRHLIDVAKATLSQSEKPKEEVQETDFSELSLSGKMKNGVFISDDLSLKAPLIRVGGEGSADLNENTVDYTVNAKVIGSLEGQTGSTDDSGLLIPVRIFGPFTKIETDILLDNMLKQRAEKKLAEAKAKANKALQEKKAELEKQKKKLAAEAKAKADAQKKKAAEALKAKQDQLNAEKAKLAAELKAKQDAAAKAAKEKAKKKLEDKLKGLF